MTHDAQTQKTELPNGETEYVYPDGDKAYQRSCPRCEGSGMLEAPARFCSMCRGDGYLVRWERGR